MGAANGDRPVAAHTQYSGDDLDIKVIHPSQRKMTKRQQTRNKLMVADTQHADFDPRAETDLYLKRARQKGKSLITTSTQQTYFGLMVMSQRTTIPRVVFEQQTNTCPQVISTQ